MSETILLNGKLLPASKAGIAVNDRGFLLGDGLFETIRFDQNNAPAFLLHWTRLKKGCSTLGIKVSLSAETLHRQIKMLLQKNCLQNKTAGVRITVTQGEGPRGLLPPKKPIPTILIQCFEITIKKPTSLSVLHSDIKINEYSPLRHFKSLNYGINIVARKQALEAGYDDALLYNTAGFLVSATCANVFLIVDHVLVTPSLESGALPGIRRQQIIERAKQQNLPVHETQLRQEDCQHAQAAFLTNSLIQQTPIHQLGKQQLPLPSGPYNLLFYK